MVLGYSRDRVGPICRTIEDCAMVFNTLHGVDEKDPSTISAPFHFDRNIKLSSLRIGVDANAPKEFVDKLVELGAKPTPIGPRPQGAPGGGGGGGESTAFFDYFVQLTARELGIDVATIEQKIAAATPRGGGRGGRGGAPADTAGRPAPVPVPPELQMLVGLPGITGQPGATAVEFIQSQRRRHMHMVEMQKFLEPYDLYLPNAGGWDVGLHSTTGHPCAVVQYKFESRIGQAVGGGPTGGAGGGRGGRAGADTLPPPVQYNAMPTCAVIAGNLFNDERDSVCRAPVPGTHRLSPRNPPNDPRGPFYVSYSATSASCSSRAIALAAQGSAQSAGSPFDKLRFRNIVPRRQWAGASTTSPSSSPTRRSFMWPPQPAASGRQ